MFLLFILWGIRLFIVFLAGFFLSSFKQIKFELDHFLPQPFRLLFKIVVTLFDTTAD